MYKRVVIKFGTSVLTSGSSKLDVEHIETLVRQCSELHKNNIDVIVCTSGAIAAGREQLGFPEIQNTITNKQMLAAVGQSHLLHVWESLFKKQNINLGLMLLTKADMEDRRRFLNARDTIQSLLKNKIIPIINENDAVATEEIKVGDNDNLSALSVILAEADLLILLTDQPGLFTSDPRKNPDAELISEVVNLDKDIHKAAGESGTGLGTGGMNTKLHAADVARRAGADVVIASGHHTDVILEIIKGEKTGTLFPALQTPLESRKRWIFAGPAPTGKIIIDDGAVKALTENNSSLLPSGIIDIIGNFLRGDTISIINSEKIEIARGISRYNSDDMEKIKGCKSNQISEVLGLTFGSAAVHRDDLILLTTEAIAKV